MVKIKKQTKTNYGNDIVQKTKHQGVLFYLHAGGALSVVATFSNRGSLLPCCTLSCLFSRDTLSEYVDQQPFAKDRVESAYLSYVFLNERQAR